MSTIPPLHIAYLCIGTNLGSLDSNLSNARLEISKWPRTRVLKESMILKTSPCGPVENQGDFLNQLLKIETFLSPLAIIDLIQITENKMGRIRKGVPEKGPRLIDIDLIEFDNLVISSKRLTLPHPSRRDRGYISELFKDIKNKNE